MKNSDTLECKQCGGQMSRGTDKTSGRPIIGAFLFLVAAAISLFLPLGWVVGAPMALVALALCLKRKTAWVCGSCGYFFHYTTRRRSSPVSWMVLAVVVVICGGVLYLTLHSFNLTP